MKLSLEILERELIFIEQRISLIRQGKVNEAKGLTLNEALSRKADFEKAIELIKKSI